MGFFLPIVERGEKIKGKIQCPMNEGLQKSLGINVNPIIFPLAESEY